MTRYAANQRFGSMAGAQWNLTLADRILSRYRAPEHRAGLERAMAKIRAALNRNPSQADATLCMHRDLMEIDRVIHSVQCAFELRAWTKTGRESAGIRRWHDCRSEEFGQLIDDYVHFVKSREDRVPALIRRWFASLAIDSPTPELQRKYSNIANHYATNRDRGGIALSQRSRIDPTLEAYTLRLRENRLRRGQADFTPEHQKESQAYFKKLLSESNKPTALLSEIRDLETNNHATFHLSLDSALSVIRRAFEQCHPSCSDEIDQLLEQGRLRLLPDSGLPDSCLDTPFGSYVQLYFDGYLNTTVRLAHELGHAIHQHLHRNSDRAGQPLNAVESETWALDFETALLDRLAMEYPDAWPALRAFKAGQRIEMNHRHRMLHRFEQALHAPGIRSVKDINTLWLETNRLFYGDGIEFDAGFERAWMEVHHLFTAPFYLLVYGVAKERADATRPTRSITRHYPTKEKETTCA